MYRKPVVRRRSPAEKRGAGRAGTLGASWKSGYPVAERNGEWRRRLNPEILIFDVDGVLVDVKETYLAVGLADDSEADGKESHLGGILRVEAAARKQRRLDDGLALGNGLGRSDHLRTGSRGISTILLGRATESPETWPKEKLLVTPRLIQKWARRRELNLFTGTHAAGIYLSPLSSWSASKSFRSVITMDDARKKPIPDGLYAILGKRDPKSALYLGDNIDDALAAQAAGVPFHGDTAERRARLPSAGEIISRTGRAEASDCDRASRLLV